jgi:type IV secretory pathway VirB10-like protein
VKAPAPTPAKTATAPVKAKTVVANSNDDVKAFGVLLSGSNSESFARRRWNPALVVTAVVVLVAAIGVPWGWYAHKRNVQMTNEAQAATPQPVTVATPAEVQPETPAPQTAPATAENDAELAKRQREARAKERAKAQEQAANADAAKPVANTSANKKAIVTVTYDENGRVTAASGGDATALRIARQKRFPPGKPGSATVTIPIN